MSDSDSIRTIREFNGDDVWRDDEGNIWVKRADHEHAVFSAHNNALGMAIGAVERALEIPWREMRAATAAIRALTIRRDS